MSEREKWAEGTRASEVLGRVVVEALQGHYGYLDRIAKITEIDYASGAPVAVTEMISREEAEEAIRAMQPEVKR